MFNIKNFHGNWVWRLAQFPWKEKQSLVAIASTFILKDKEYEPSYIGAINQQGVIMFKELKEINSRPDPFQFYTADELWTNEYTSKQMLEYHLNESVDISSRNMNFISNL